MSRARASNRPKSTSTVPAHSPGPVLTISPCPLTGVAASAMLTLSGARGAGPPGSGPTWVPSSSQPTRMPTPSAPIRTGMPARLASISVTASRLRCPPEAPSINRTDRARTASSAAPLGSSTAGPPDPVNRTPSAGSAASDADTGRSETVGSSSPRKPSPTLGSKRSRSPVADQRAEPASIVMVLRHDPMAATSPNCVRDVRPSATDSVPVAAERVTNPEDAVRVASQIPLRSRISWVDQSPPPSSPVRTLPVPTTSTAGVAPGVSPTTR